MALLKVIAELLSLALCLFRMTVRIKKPPVPTKRATVDLIKVIVNVCYWYVFVAI